MFYPPLIDECEFPIEVPDAFSLMLRAWELRLSPNPDPANGEVNIVTLPAEVGDGYVAVVWEGEVEISGATPGDGTCQNSHRIFPVTGGTEIKPKNDLPARVAILGIDNVKRPIGPLGRGAYTFSNEPLEGRAVTFILRVLDFTGVTDEVAIEAWPRPGFLLTMIDGPRICGMGDPTNPIPELDFVALAIDKPELICAGSSDASLAFLLDYYVVGDPVQVRVSVDRDEQGCRLRCWGGGI